MSARDRLSRREQRVLAIGDRKMIGHKCGRCMADPGEWCRTARGNRAAMLHSPRYYAACAAGDLPLTDADLAGVS